MKIENQLQTLLQDWTNLIHRVQFRVRKFAFKKLNQYEVNQPVLKDMKMDG